MRQIFLFNHAPVAGSITLSGTVYFWASASQGVNTVTMSMTGADVQTVYTDASGNYSFTSTASGVFIITPMKHNWTNVTQSLVLNGVTSADTTMVTNHNAGTALFTSIYQYIAADVNGSNSITNVDGTIISQAIIGNTTALNNIRSRKNWRFVQFAYSQSVPPSSWAFPSSHSLNTSVSTSSLDFYAIKVADVNGTADTTIV